MSVRYTGKQATIERYKTARKNAMKRIASLKEKGVTVPESLIPKQGGHVVMADVHNVEKLTREYILKKSTITVKEKKSKGKGTDIVTYKGSDVAKVLRREENKKQREVREKLAKGEYTRLDEFGVIVDKKGNIVKRIKNKYKKQTPIKIDEPSPIEPGKDTGITVDDDFGTGASPEFERYDSYRMYIDFVLADVGNYAADDRIGRENLPRKLRDQVNRAKSIMSYINDAVSKYGSEKVGEVLIEMSKMNFPSFYIITYIDTEYDRYVAMLSKMLPIKGRKEFDLYHNDYDTEVYNEEDYE